MRPFEEIERDILAARKQFDIEAMLSFANEIETLGTTESIAVAQNTKGFVQLTIGNYPQALEDYRRALVCFTELGNQTEVARITSSIGNVFYASADYEKALDHYRNSLQLAEDINDVKAICSNLNNMGNVFMELTDYPEALRYYRRALSAREEQGSSDGAAGAIGNIVAVLIRTGSFEEAEQLLQRQATLPMVHPDVRSIYHMNASAIAESRGDFEQATQQMLNALSIAQGDGLRLAEAHIHLGLRNLARKRNHFDGYIEHNNEYTRITEEIRGKEATQKIAMLEAEKRIESELRERDKERALLYGALPKTIADRMIRGENVSGDHHNNASVIFLDIVNFTNISDSMPPEQVVSLLRMVFATCDAACRHYNTTKIKTIGDSYLAVAGI